MKRTAEILYNYNAYYSVTVRVRRAENILPINPTCDTASHLMTIIYHDNFLKWHK